MAERYTRVYTQQGQFYCPGAPVIIEAGALLKDNQTGKIIAQLKFKNISPNRLRALTVRIFAKDISGAEVEGVESFQYLDLDVPRDGEFGAKTPIMLPNAVARSFACECRSAVFANGNTWNCAENALCTSLPAPISLSNKINGELIEQYRRDTVTSAQYVVTDHEDLWYCACGAINHTQESVCHHCRAKKVALLAALNSDILKANKKKHDDAVAVRQAEIEAEKQCRVQKLKKIVIITVAAIAVLTALILITAKVIIPNSNYNNALVLMDAGKYEEAIAAFKALDNYKDSKQMIEDCKIGILDDKYDAALALMQEGKYNEAIAVFKALSDHRDSVSKIKECEDAILAEKYEAPYQNAIALMNAKKYTEAISAFEKLDGYKDSAKRITECQNLIQQQKEAELASQYNSAKKLMDQGKTAKAAIAFGKLGNYKDSKSLSKSLWDKVAVRETISAGYQHTVGLKEDGTMVAVGSNYEGERNVSSWKNIIAISAGSNHTVGLKIDGTVVAVGWNKFGQCNVSGWKNIVAITAGGCHTVGLKADGTVVAVGDNKYGQCNVSSWKNIVAIAAGYCHTVGLKADGTVVGVGWKSYGQCNVSGWKNIVAIAAGSYHTIGLKADGTVVAVGDNDVGQCNVSGWKNIVAISSDSEHTVGLKADGTVVAVDWNDEGQCNVSGWKNIVAIAAGGRCTVGLKADGTVVAVGWNTEGECNVSGWKNIKIPSK